MAAREHNDAAIFPFGGGPGEPTTSGVEDEVKLFGAEIRRHDVVLVDQRGTGGSAPLACSDAQKAHRRELMEGDLFPLPFIAILAGWYTAEVGRQPWVVYGVLRTAEAMTPFLTARAATISFVVFCAVYSFIFAFGVFSASATSPTFCRSSSLLILVLRTYSHSCA